jgi:CspA family cold shock protein
MADIIVKLVRYDTDKTKKRKREDLIVEAQTEYSVIKKLEKIHKNDSIVAIHEIIWGQVAPVKKSNLPVVTGIVKFFSTDKGFGFIAPDAEMDDLFFHTSALGGEVVQQDDLVEFEISEGPKGPIAIRVKVFDKE